MLVHLVISSNSTESNQRETYVVVGILSTVALLTVYSAQFLLFTVFPLNSNFDTQHSWHYLVSWTFGLEATDLSQPEVI
jgi:hypothetical protein